MSVTSCCSHGHVAPVTSIRYSGTEKRLNFMKNLKARSSLFSSSSLFIDRIGHVVYNKLMEPLVASASSDYFGNFDIMTRNKIHRTKIANTNPVHVWLMKPLKLLY